VEGKYRTQTPLAFFPARPQTSKPRTTNILLYRHKALLTNLPTTNTLYLYSTAPGKLTMLNEICGEFKEPVTGLFLSNENTVGPAIDLLALVLREASRDRRSEIIV